MYYMLRELAIDISECLSSIFKGDTILPKGLIFIEFSIFILSLEIIKLCSLFVRLWNVFPVSQMFCTVPNKLLGVLLMDFHFCKWYY